MGSNPAVLFTVFKAAGMLTQAKHKPLTTPTDFDCDFKRPEQLLLGDQQQSAEIVIEYETGKVPRIRKGDPILINGTTYKARAHATTVGDGFYSQCQLET
jgi:hypothetical protein